MSPRFFIFLTTLAFLIPTSVFAQCVIDGGNYNEGESDIEPCDVCDSARSATEWSSKNCAIPGVDPGCQIDVCVLGIGCASRKLPEHTRCVEPLCTNGAINQTECSIDGLCNEEREKSCQGFTCLDAVSCTTECVDNDDCTSPATCVGQTCKNPVISEDMGTDTSVGDMGVDTIVEVDLPTGDMGGEADMKKEGDTGGGHVVPADSGCGCATNDNASWLGFLLFGCFAIRRPRRRKK